MTKTNIESKMIKDEYSPNVGLIRSEGYRIIHATIPRQVRKELMHGVKAGDLGRLKKDRLKPEVFYHPDYEGAAIASQKEIEISAIKTLAQIIG